MCTLRCFIKTDAALLLAFILKLGFISIKLTILIANFYFPWILYKLEGPKNCRKRPEFCQKPECF